MHLNISIGAVALLFAPQLFAAQPALSAPGAARQPAYKRTVLSVVVLDSLNTDWNSQLEGREAVKTMLETLPPGNRVAIFALGDRLHLLHDFSSDTASLVAAVDRYPGEQPFYWVDGKDSSANPIAAQFPSSKAWPSSEAWRYGTAVDWGWRAPYTSDAAFAQQQRILTTFDAMTRIARIMGHASGRSYLLWVSSAFPLYWYPPEAVEAMRAMNTARLALYAIDPRGVLQNFQAEANIDTMKDLAEQTGGRTFFNSNDVGGLMRVAMAVLSNEE